MIVGITTRVSRRALGTSRALSLTVTAEARDGALSDVCVRVAGDALPFGLGDLAEDERAIVEAGLRRAAQEG